MSSNSNEYFKVQSNVTGWDGCTKLFIFCKKKINKGDVDYIELLCFLILLIRSCLKRLTRKTMARFTSGLPSHLQVQDYFVTFITLLTFRCVWRCLGPAFEIATFFREVVLFLRAVNDDVDNNLKVVFCMYLTDVIKGCFPIPILGEKPVGPIRHKWGRCSSLPTVLCESSFSQLYSCGIINHYDWLLNMIWYILYDRWRQSWLKKNTQDIMGELKECGWKKADEKKEAEVGETAIKCWQKRK